ncbi:hypothetical protein BKA69DRAFT_1058926 [Paraphysoderma sedebokerense]|nr:hypothetical protein BKA69DRAFT_1058926 [Paraphysoderma sedebokerense]
MTKRYRPGSGQNKQYRMFWFSEDIYSVIDQIVKPTRSSCEFQYCTRAVTRNI